MEVMPTEGRTRFDISYDATSGHQRLTIKCNFPEFEVGATRTSRCYVGPRAVARMKEVRKLAALPPERMERWIVFMCGVGGTGIFRPAANQTDNSLVAVNKILRELGEMKSSDLVKLV